MSKFVALVGKRCVACGACVQVCPRNAIAVKNGISAVVDSSSCIGCGICVKTCPAGIIERIERSHYE